MSQSSIAEQVAEMREAGVPVRKGVKALGEGRPSGTPGEIGSRVWLNRWANNAFRNYPVVSRAAGVRFLVDSCHGMPAFVVGAGPSLDHDLASLREIRGRAIILATDAAFRALLAHGIRPDLVLTYDCKAEQSLLWKTVPPHNVPLVVDSCAHPLTIASWAGPVVFYNHWHQQDEFSRIILPTVYPTIGQLPSGATVGNVAILLAKLIGCLPVITVGMDFCYGRQGDGWVYRAKDWRCTEAPDMPGGTRWEPDQIVTLYDNTERLARSHTIMVNNTEERVDQELSAYLDTFLTFIKKWKIDVINVSGTSLLRHHVMTMPVADAISKYCGQEVFGGRTMVRHLAKVLDDPRRPAA